MDKKLIDRYCKWRCHYQKIVNLGLIKILFLYFTLIIIEIAYQYTINSKINDTPKHI